MSAPGGLLVGGLGGGGVSRAEPVLLVSERPVPEDEDNFTLYYVNGFSCHTARRITCASFRYAIPLVSF